MLNKNGRQQIKLAERLIPSRPIDILASHLALAHGGNDDEDDDAAIISKSCERR